MIQQFYSWVYIQKKSKTLIQKDICTPLFIVALIQQPRQGNKPSAHQQTNGLRMCGTNIQQH